MKPNLKSLLAGIAVVAVAGVLFGSIYTSTHNTQTTPQSIDKVTPQSINSVTAKDVANVGGLVFNIVGADAIPLDQVATEQANGRIVHQITLTAQSVDLPIPGGQKYHAMTFNGQVPGPTIRVTQGDVIDVTLTVPSNETTGHSLDMHAARISAVPNFGPVMPGKSNEYAYIAHTPGVFKYHCEGVGVIGMDQHVLSGMYGMIIVDPLNGYHKLLITRTAAQNGQLSITRTLVDPAAYEFTLQYNQLYIDSTGSYNQDAMFKHQTTWTVVNGKPFGYDPVVTKVWKGAGGHDEAAPIIVPVGQHIRYFVLNQGDQPLFFHIVGAILDRVTQGNMVQAMGTQTWYIGGSQDAIVDVVYDEPGAYVAVNHDYAAIFSGAATVQLAQASAAPNPSDAVPPDSAVPGTSIHQDTFVHCECSAVVTVPVPKIATIAIVRPTPIDYAVLEVPEDVVVTDKFAGNGPNPYTTINITINGTIFSLSETDKRSGVFILQGLTFTHGPTTISPPKINAKGGSHVTILYTPTMTNGLPISLNETIGSFEIHPDVTIDQFNEMFALRIYGLNNTINIVNQGCNSSNTHVLNVHATHAHDYLKLGQYAGAYNELNILDQNITGSHGNPSLVCDNTKVAFLHKLVNNAITSIVAVNTPNSNYAGIQLSPNSGQVGTTVYVTGSGFIPGSQITIKYDSAIVTSNQTAATVNGTIPFPTKFQVPMCSNGTHIVTARDATGIVAAANFIRK